MSRADRVYKHFAKKDKVIELILLNPLFDIRTDGTVWTRISRNGAGLIPDDRWRKLGTQDGRGYYRFSVKTDMFEPGTEGIGRSSCVLIHRVVFAKYVGKLDNSMVVNHINGVKTDNRPGNLELVSLKANWHHCLNVLKHNPIQNYTLSFQIADEIRALKTEGWTHKDLGEKFGISKGHVSDIVNNKIWINREYDRKEP